MLFFVGVILIVVSLIMIIRVYLSSKKPRVDDAQVVDWAMEYFEIKGRVTPRKVPVGRIEYFYRSVKYNAEIMLKSKRLNAGDKIQLAVNPDKPEQVEHYLAGREIMVAFLIMLIGAAFLVPAILIWMGVIQF